MANVNGTSGDETLNGTAGDDVLNAANGGTDVLFGGAGNDRLIADGGGDRLYGGIGGVDIADLRFQTMTSGVTIDLAGQLALTNNANAQQNDIVYRVNDAAGNTVATLSSIERLFFYGGSGNDSITGGAFDDRLDGGTGNDVIFGGGGNDEIFGHVGNRLLDGGTGNDVIRIDGKVDEIRGGDGFDRLYITGTAGLDPQGRLGDIQGVEQIFVQAGLSQLSFSRNQTPQIANGQVFGHNILVQDVGDGNGGFLGATIIASESADTVKGGRGDDRLFGNKGNDTLYGGDGNDYLEGGVGGDRLYGGAGDDRFRVNSGPNQQPDVIVDGGDGNDSINLNNGFVTTDLTVDFRTPSTAQTINGTTIVNVEVLEYNGGSGVDTVFGGAFDDKISTAAGDDVVTGGGGDDLLTGGAGADTAVYTGNRADYTVATAGGTTTVTDGVLGRDGTDSLREFEFLQFADGQLNLSTGVFG